MNIQFDMAIAKSVISEYLMSISLDRDNQEACLLLKQLSIIISNSARLEHKAIILAKYFESTYTLLPESYLSASSLRFSSSYDWHKAVMVQWVGLFVISHAESLSASDGMGEFLRLIESSIELLPTVSILSADNFKSLIV